MGVGQIRSVGGSAVQQATDLQKKTGSKNGPGSGSPGLPFSGRFPAPGADLQDMEASHAVVRGGPDFRPVHHNHVTPPRYGLIYADPPWWHNRRRPGDRLMGGVWGLYQPMRDDNLLAMRPQLDAWADDPCALAMWATSTRADFAWDLLRAWGFTPICVHRVWVKADSLRRWARYDCPQTEQLLLGRRGSLPRPAVRPDQVLYHVPGAPHEKPARVRDDLERMWPSARKLELFARHLAPGWDAWGDQVGFLDRHEGGA